MRAAALALAVPLALSGCFARAQAQGELCLPHAVMVKMLKDKHREVPIAFGLISPDRMMQLFVSPSDTSTWTVLGIRADGMACLIAGGNHWSGMDELPKPGDPV